MREESLRRHLILNSSARQREGRGWRGRLLVLFMHSGSRLEVQLPGSDRQFVKAFTCRRFAASSFGAVVILFAGGDYSSRESVCLFVCDLQGATWLNAFRFYCCADRILPSDSRWLPIPCVRVRRCRGIACVRNCAEIAHSPRGIYCVCVVLFGLCTFYR